MSVSRSVRFRRGCQGSCVLWLGVMFFQVSLLFLFCVVSAEEMSLSLSLSYLDVLSPVSLNHSKYSGVLP